MTPVHERSELALEYHMLEMTEMALFDQTRLSEIEIPDVFRILNLHRVGHMSFRLMGCWDLMEFSPNDD